MLALPAVSAEISRTRSLPEPATGYTQTPDAAASAVLRADQPGSVVKKNIYGHFAEHLGRGIYEGIWVGPDSPTSTARTWPGPAVVARSTGSRPSSAILWRMVCRGGRALAGVGVHPIPPRRGVPLPSAATHHPVLGYPWRLSRPPGPECQPRHRSGAEERCPRGECEQCRRFQNRRAGRR